MAGSFAIFLAAFLMILFRNRFIPAAAILLVVFGVMAWHDLLYLAFGFGLALACLHAAGRLVPPRPVAPGLVCAAMYAFGYHGGGTTYTWLPVFDPESGAVTMICTAASAALISGIIAWPRARSGLSGRVGRLLGSLSFPIYLVHVPVILSVGCAALVALQPGWGGNVASAGMAVMSLMGTAGAAWLVWIADRRWVASLNRIVDRVSRFGRIPMDASSRLAPIKSARP
jgi:peptidoglycan/LPS O-acetylase OafA/YrhL